MMYKPSEADSLDMMNDGVLLTTDYQQVTQILLSFLEVRHCSQSSRQGDDEYCA